MFITKEDSIKEILAWIDSFLTASVLQNIPITPSIRVIGKTVSSMAEESSLGVMILIMMETMLRAKSMDRAYSGTHPRKFTREVGETASNKEKVFCLMRREIRLRRELGRMASLLDRDNSETKNDTLIR